MRGNRGRRTTVGAHQHQHGVLEFVCPGPEQAKRIDQHAHIAPRMKIADVEDETFLRRWPWVRRFCGRREWNADAERNDADPIWPDPVRCFDLLP